MTEHKTDMEKDIKNLFALIASVKTAEDCALLFQDLCTNKEVEQMSQRVKAAKMLLEKKTYNEVMEQTEISSATLSRVSRCVQYGKGYVKFIKPDKKK